MKNNVLISIIVPVFNAQDYITKCIESVLNQTYDCIELILVNDGSTDNSESLCLNYNDSRIKYFKKDNGGVSSARNFGIKKASGKYIMFLDSDDFLDSNCLMSLMQSNNNKKLPLLPVRMITARKEKNNFDNNKTYLKDEFFVDIINGKIGGFCWGYLFDASIVKNTIFNENIKYMEDSLFLFNYLITSDIEEILITVNNNYYNYINNPNSATNKRINIINKIEDMFYVLDEINIKTDSKYFDIISDKKIRLLEAEMRFLKQKDEFYNIIKNVEIRKYSTKNIRYNLFSTLYLKKYIFLLRIYYIIRKIAKKGG